MLINIMIWEIHIVSVLPFYFKRIVPAVVAAGLFISACDTGGDPVLPKPEPVSMVAHTFANDTMASEYGIDAVPESDGIYLAWYSQRDPNIIQYNIYRMKGDSYFQPIRSIVVEGATPGKDTTYTDDNADNGLDLNIYYSYFVTAMNKNGEEGLPLDTVQYKLIDKPLLIRPYDATYDPDVSGLPILEWRFDDMIRHEYIVRIENIFEQVHYIGIFQSNYDNHLQITDLNEIEGFPPFIPGDYRWRIDSVGPEADNSGAESDWYVFTII